MYRIAPVPFPANHDAGADASAPRGRAQPMTVNVPGRPVTTDAPAAPAGHGGAGTERRQRTWPASGVERGTPARETDLPAHAPGASHREAGISARALGASHPETDTSARSPSALHHEPGVSAHAPGASHRAPGTAPGEPNASNRERGPSPWEGDRVRPLSRRQIEDRFQDLGELYEATSGGSRNNGNGNGNGNGSANRDAFLRRLAGEVRRPGFALLIAENTTLTACAYGFPVRAADPWWQGHDTLLPRLLHGLAVTGGLFAVSGIVVPPRVRTHYQDRDWNLARRLQRRLLADHAPALGVTLVPRTDAETLTAYRAWGWQDVVADPDGLDPRLPGSCRVLVLRP